MADWVRKGERVESTQYRREFAFLDLQPDLTYKEDEHGSRWSFPCDEHGVPLASNADAADEIAGGLTEHECAELVKTIKEIHAGGTTIVWIEHIVHALVSVASRLVVMNFGQVLAEGDPHEVMANASVREVYMGIPVS